jgi:hypothetical protein
MNEMKLLEEFCAAVPPPSAERLGPARARLLAAAGLVPPDTAPGARRRLWRVTPARLVWTGALAVVTAAVLIAALGLTSGHGPAVGAAGGPAAPSADAARVLYRAATTALTQPVPGPGQYIYTEVTGPASVILPDGRPGTKRAVVATWQSVDGTKAGAIEGQNSCHPLNQGQAGLLPGVTLSPPPSSEPTLSAGKPANFKPRPTPARCSATILPATWSPPGSTYAGLKTLPTSPAALLAYLNAHFQWLTATGMTVTSADREYMAISTILENLGVLPRALEAAMFRALAEFPGMTVVPDVTDYADRSGIAVAWPNGDYRFELIFNSSTYQFMGQQEVAEPTGQVVSAMALLASGVTSTIPAVSRGISFLPILWQDFASGLPDTN